MKTRVTRLIQCIAACNGALLFASTLHAAGAQEATNLPYLNPQLSPEQRATDLVRAAGVTRIALMRVSHAILKRLIA